MGNLNNSNKFDLSQGIPGQYHQTPEDQSKSNYRRNNISATNATPPTPSPSQTTPTQMKQHPIDLGLQDPSLITPYLLLGGAMVNKNPDLASYLGITHVVNMAVELYPHHELASGRGIVYKHIRSDDSLQYNIRVHFEEAFEIIDDARNGNGRVLVHCMMGISRSATIVIAYLMSRYGMQLRQAYTLVKQRRPEINPNPLFFQILEEFERELMHARVMLMNKSAAAIAERNFQQLNEYNQQQHRTMMRNQHGGKYFTLKPNSSSYGGSSSIYNQRSMSPVPMMSGGAPQYSSIIGTSDYQQRYAF